MEYTFCFDIADREVEVTVEVDVTYGNDGIGAYEYWGAKCYDHGHPTAEAGDIDVISASWTDDNREINIEGKTKFAKLVSDAFDKCLDDFQEKALEKAESDREEAEVERAIARHEHYFEDR
jgi:hypothetical protein